MPRKKVLKTRLLKTKNHKVSLLDKMENDFRAIPNKLPTLLDKDLGKLKKQENKLQSSLLKMQKQQATAKNKHTVLTAKAKTKASATTKKQLTAARKIMESLSSASAQLAAQIDEIRQHSKLLSQKQAKFSEICKFIVSLDKKWDKKSSKAAKPAGKIKQVRKPRKNAASAVAMMEIAPHLQNTADTSAETTETNS